MSVLSVKRTWRGEYSNASGEQWAYRVHISDAGPVSYEGIVTACDGTTCIPDYGTELLATPWVVVDKSVSADHADPHFFTVYVKFGLPIPEWQLAGSNVRWGHTIDIVGIEIQQPVWWGWYVGKDSASTDGTSATFQKIVNSAGQQYNPAITRTYYDTEYRINYVTETLDGSLEDIRGAINNDSFTVNWDNYTKHFDKGQLKVGNVQTTLTLAAGQLKLWKVMLPLVYRADYWIYHLEDKGMYFRNNAPIPDAIGLPVTEPVPLDGSGHKLDLTGSPTYHTNDYYLDDPKTTALLPYITEIAS